MEVSSSVTTFEALGDHQVMPVESFAHPEICPPETFANSASSRDVAPREVTPPVEEKAVEKVPDDYFDDFVEDLSDPECVQQIYDFSLRQVRGMVDYNDEDDIIQEVFYRLHKWPIGKKYNSAKHYFSLLKITIRQAIAAYWKRRHSQRNDVRKRVFISQLQRDGEKNVEFAAASDSVWKHLHLKDLIQRVMEKAEMLSEQQKAVFQLRFMEDKPHEEVAKALGVSIRTSYRLETKVREILQSYFPSFELDT